MSLCLNHFKKNRTQLNWPRSLRLHKIIYTLSFAESVPKEASDSLREGLVEPLGNAPPIHEMAETMGFLDVAAPLVEAAAFPDVAMDELAGLIPLVTADRLGWLEHDDAVEAETPDDAADGSRRDTDLGGNLFAGPALPAQGLNLAEARFATAVCGVWRFMQI